MAFDNPETLTLLGAVAAWTSRVRLVTTVVVPQLHRPLPLAKALATADRLSGGRLTVGLGVGGRVEDYRAAEADAPRRSPSWPRGSRSMKRVWAGEKLTEADPPGRPAPAPGRRPAAAGRHHGSAHRALRGGLGRRAGRLHPRPRRRPRSPRCTTSRATAWSDAGRPAPLLTTSFWVALARPRPPVPEARAQVHRHLRHYMNWLPPELVDAMAPTTGFAGTAAELRDLLRRLEDVGTDEVHVIPTSSDVALVERVAELADRGNSPFGQLPRCSNAVK